jgi:hypothetical protein
MRRLLVLAVLCGVACLGFVSRSESRPESGWAPLFNGKDLSGWTPFFNGRDKAAKFDDLVQVSNGEIHIYPEGKDGDKAPFGYLRSAKAYSHYHLRLEYKWGTKRFVPKQTAKRDSGMLYHVVGPDKVWPRCVELQVQEGDTGDIFTVNTRVTATVDPKKPKYGVDKSNASTFLAADKGGVAHTQGTKGITRVIKSETAERDGWNIVEAIVAGGSATHIVNGKVVNQCTDIQQPGPGDTWVPLTAGQIILQAEGAEVFYRNIDIKPVAGGPFEAP